MHDRYYWAALQMDVNVGARSLLHLYRYFPSGRAVLDASKEELKRVPRLTTKGYERLIEGRGMINIEKIADDLQKKEISVVLLGEPSYPRALTQIADPPVILYTRGRSPEPEMPLVGIVGSRRATPYGRAIAHKLSRELAQLGWGIVSGMARGIDTAAHKGALDVGGYTLAVLGCGVNVCYPRENNKLMQRILDKGFIISEFPPDVGPHAKNFPIRNRIISGCSMGIIVVEAGERSGSLITAYNALEQDREVFAIPGPITNKYSKGTNRLIKQGAKLVEDVTDIVEEFPYLDRVSLSQGPLKRDEEPSLTLEESCVLQNLSLEPVHIDLLTEKTGLSVSVIGGILTLLEFRGLAKQLPGECFINPEIVSEQKG